MKPVLVFLLILGAISVEARIHGSDWKDGVLMRVTKDHIARESLQLGKKSPKHGVYISYYYIESENFLYEGDDVELKNHEKGFPVSVNGPIKFYLAGSDMYIRDDRGKQHKLRLVNVLPIQASAAQPSPADRPKQ